jgi:hypothetical protein
LFLFRPVAWAVVAVVGSERQRRGNYTIADGYAAAGILRKDMQQIVTSAESHCYHSLFLLPPRERIIWRPLSDSAQNDTKAARSTIYRTWEDELMFQWSKNAR